MNAEAEIAALKAGTGQAPAAEGIRFVAIGPREAAERTLTARHADWRNANRDAFRSNDPTTADNTARWLTGIATEQPRRLIFELRNETDDTPFGAIGVSGPEEAGGPWYLESVLRGASSGPRGAMGLAVSGLCRWCAERLNAPSVRVNCFADQTAAVALYHRAGFRPLDLIPLIPAVIPGGERWDPAPETARPERYFIVLEWIAETQ